MVSKTWTLIAVCLVIRLSRAEWTYPYFIDIHDEIKVYENVSRYWTIEMNEEIPWPFTVAYLNEYSGSQGPTVQFSDGLPENLGLTFEQIESRWAMVITARQDYENVNNRRYRIDIPDQQLTLAIVVRNIFDNRPVVDILANPCFVDELNEPNHTSNCFYNVTDADGFLDNELSFRVEGNNNETDLFAFEMLPGQTSEYHRVYAIVLKKMLHYEERFIYSFSVTVSDIGDNEFPFNIIIRVEDLPNLPPMWTKAFASEQFDEKQAEDLIFNAFAIDGDTGIDDPICYRLEYEEEKNYSNLTSIEERTGEIRVKPIDRDALQISFFPFNVTAFECNNQSSYITSPAVLIVNDINDNLPEIHFDEAKSVIRFYEETFVTLFSASDLFVEDIDLAQHATYNVFLSPPNFAIAFTIAPESGYQRQNFSIFVAQAAMLDFDKTDEFRNFSMSIFAVEVDEESHSRNRTFRVELINWNDEVPRFTQEQYNFTVEETVAKDFPIGSVDATDDDFGDSIEYFMTGSIGERIGLDLLSGLLSTIADNVFDFEQQQEVNFQVFARDTLQTDKEGESIHTTPTQVHITVIDVNDTPPSIILPRNALSVVENSTEEIVIAVLEVVDPDTTADLVVEIDWDESGASGVNVQKSDYEGCVVLEIVEISRNRLNVIVKTDPASPIDYEKFQILFLAITATDRATAVNNATTSAVLTIKIDDINDSAPEFVGNTLSATRSVLEESGQDIFVGFINAFDPDGPGNNVITYSLNPTDDETDGWLKINSATGEILVDADRKIDCDNPKRFNLDYTITLFDGVFTTMGDISIAIVDTNNKVPQIGEFKNEIQIFENASDISLTIINAFDDDRDAPHNVLQFSISLQNNPQLQRFFDVDFLTGELRVKELDEFNHLDRDLGPAEYFITLIVEDNEGRGIRNTNSTTVHVILLDVNDNAPQMPPELTFAIPIRENILESTVLVEQFYAPDIDEGVNAEVDYSISSIEPIETHAENPTGYENLFKIRSYGNKYAEISAGIDLRGFSGNWELTIVATDRGEEGNSSISQSSNGTYVVTIDPFNFNSPRIIFPESNSVLRLDYGATEVGRPLILLNTSRLASFEAIDEDAGIYGDVTFILDSDNGDHRHFEMVKFSRSNSDLRVSSDIEEKIYRLNIVAMDEGGLNSSVHALTLAFLDRNSQPYFVENEWTTIFTENVTGLEEIRTIPNATDVKNVGVTDENERYQIFYFIDDTFRAEDAQLFTLNSITRELKLAQQLDREAVDRHTIRIIATNQDTKPNALTVSENSFLTVAIEVDDVNDNPPSFLYERYSTSITESDGLGKPLAIFEATDPDLNDNVTYYLLRDSITVSNDELLPVKDTAFVLNQMSGVLSLNFQVQKNMTGFFEFQIEARDLVNHTATLNVKIFIVSDLNRVSFTFSNTTEELENANRDILVEIYANLYNADCVIDDLIADPEDVTRSILRTYFVKDDEPVDGSKIEERIYDNYFYNELRNRLKEELDLVLVGVQSEIKDEEDERSNVLEIALATTVGILAVALGVLIVIYMFQVKSYNRQIKALSQEKTEPAGNNFNNLKAVPNTNLFSEGKQVNPVMGMNNYNNSRNADLDTKSINSADSDFANLNDIHIFDINLKSEKTDSTYA